MKNIDLGPKLQFYQRNDTGHNGRPCFVVGFSVFFGGPSRKKQKTRAFLYFEALLSLFA